MKNDHYIRSPCVQETIKYKSLTTNRFLFNFKKSPGYSIYNGTGKSTLILPSISSEKRKKNYFLKNRNKNQNHKGIKEESEEISKIINRSGYKSKKREVSK